MSAGIPNVWLVIGFTGQIIFGLRFLVQWICSEIKRESHIPIVFWYLSISGGMILLTYAIFRRDPVFILGQSTGLIVYLRNLHLIYQKRRMEGKEGKGSGGKVGT
ncbi:MAG: hypothetical protein A3C36_05665 [Omnitrophica WOR_2 bacterium RIFCSPHIGHO2_02_FULL_52_10]|nr:MAG: hypothetical protein A3C36_05665 [Omnitrophica WOR_2 bacterium RIFCSPHIGHO2_02_FULL_52_10]